MIVFPTFVFDLESNLNPDQLANKETYESIGVEIEINDVTYEVIGVYRPPYSSVLDLNTNFFNY